jgi:hypothetical protein
MHSDRRLVLAAWMATLALALFGLYARGQMLEWGLVRPGPVNVFFYLYALHERTPLVVIVLWTVVTAALLRRRAGATETWRIAERLGPPRARWVGALAAALAVVALGTWYRVHHGVLLTMDEFTSDFQARIMAHGDLLARLPEGWRPYTAVLAPVFTAYEGLDGAWVSEYLPGYALLKTPFVMAGAGPILNPLLAGASVVLMAAVARRLWPDEGLRPWLALLFFATSSEVLLTSGTGYSMPAHLALNLLWLWLYQRGDARSWGLALAVGVLAMGLHNPVPHGLFVAPFLLRVARERRWGRFGAAVAAYAAGAMVWMAWLRMANPYARDGGAGMFAMFALPTLLNSWLQLVNFSLLLTWQAPAFGALAIVGIVRARRLDPVLADLATGVVLTLAFYFFFPLTQGHGWGYRYAYQVLGNLALLAAAGAPALVSVVGTGRAYRLLGASFAIALLVQVPLRFIQTELFIRPWAAAYHDILRREAEVVLVHGDSIWYSRDLIRNDPYLRGQPVVVAARYLSPAQQAAIVAAHPGRVVDVKDGELLRLGLRLWVQHGR